MKDSRHTCRVWKFSFVLGEVVKIKAPKKGEILHSVDTKNECHYCSCYINIVENNHYVSVLKVATWWSLNDDDEKWVMALGISWNSFRIFWIPIRTFDNDSRTLSNTVRSDLSLFTNSSTHIIMWFESLKYYDKEAWGWEKGKYSLGQERDRSF